MKVRELKQSLRFANDDDDVTISIRLPYATMGPQPTVGIKWAQSGFDWNKGKFMLSPEENLTPSDRDFEKQMRDMQDKLGEVDLLNMQLKSEIRRLKKQID